MSNLVDELKLLFACRDGMTSLREIRYEVIEERPEDGLALILAPEDKEGVSLGSMGLAAISGIYGGGVEGAP